MLLPLSLALAAVAAPITDVTVYSDRARVIRTADVKVAGTQKIELPLLLDTVDPATIWVEASGAEVRRVDIAHVEAEQFPRTEARELLGKLDKLDDEIARVRGDRAAAETVLNAIGQLRPTVSTDETMRPLPKLNPTGWGAVLGWVGSWNERLHARIRDLDEKLTDLGRERALLAEQARLIGGAGRRSGYKVTPTLAGDGAARVRLSYVVGGARWTPVYDLQLAPDKGTVLVSFAGRVSQESGEDWEDARLVLSTSVPATSTVFPKLVTWKIGEKERFIPMPLPATENYRAPPSAPPLLAAEQEDEVLRRRLVARAASDATGKDIPESINGFEDHDGDGIPDKVDANADGDYRYKAKVRELAKKTAQLREEVARSRARMEKLEEQAAAPEPPPPPAAPMAAPAAPIESDVMMTRPVLAGQPAVRRRAASFGGTYFTADTASTTEEVPTAAVGLAPPAGWRAPVYAPDLPASLAGGYDLAFPSLRPETVRSGKGARRVALFAEEWPVGVERRLFPALAPDAFLVAEIKNPSTRVLPGGEATLFVGADPAGTAKLQVVAPREAFTLPLGLDRAVRPVRNVKLVLAEKGIFMKDEINQYLVTTEVANPYRAPLKVRIVDQVPLSNDKNVEVKLVTADGAKQDKDTGALEWQLTVPPSQKASISFVYTVRRPKGWRLHQ